MKYIITILYLQTKNSAQEQKVENLDETDGFKSCPIVNMKNGNPALGDTSYQRPPPGMEPNPPGGSGCTIL